MIKKVYITKDKTATISDSWQCPFFDEESSYCEAADLLKSPEHRICIKPKGWIAEIPEWCPLEEA